MVRPMLYTSLGANALQLDVSSSYSQILDESHDSGVYNISYGQPQAKKCHSDKLSCWQEKMVRCWFDEKLRLPNEEEMLGLFVLSQAPKAEVEACISNWLQKGKFKATESQELDTKLLGWTSRANNEDEAALGYNPQARVMRECRTSDNIVSATHCFGLTATCGNLSSQTDVPSNDLPGTDGTSVDGCNWPQLPFYDWTAISITNSTLDLSQGTGAGHDCNSASDSGYHTISNNNLSYDGTSRNQIMGPLRPTKALRHLASRVICNSIRSGCKQTGHRRTQNGIYACTLGCDYRTKRPSDLSRHEQIVYPQQVYFCLACGDPTNPSEKHLFTREDKLLKHIRSFHPGTITPAQCRLTGIRTIVPERCRICLHHRHFSWEERREHIIQHYNLGHTFPPIAHQHLAEHQDWISDDNDDDEDDENNNNNGDNDEGDSQGNQHQSDKNEGGGSGEPADGRSSSGHGRNKEHGNGKHNDDNNGNESFTIPEWRQSENWQVSLPGRPELASFARKKPYPGTQTVRTPVVHEKNIQRPVVENTLRREGKAVRFDVRRGARPSLRFIGIPEAHDALAVYFRWIRQARYHRGKVSVASSDHADTLKCRKPFLITPIVPVPWDASRMAYDLAGSGAWCNPATSRSSGKGKADLLDWLDKEAVGNLEMPMRPSISPVRPYSHRIPLSLHMPENQCGMFGTPEVSAP